MELHKTGFPKEAEPSRNGYRIKSGLEPREAVSLAKQIQFEHTGLSFKIPVNSEL